MADGFAIDWGTGAGDAFAFEPEVLLSLGDAARAAVEEETGVAGIAVLDLGDAGILHRHESTTLGPDELVQTARHLRDGGLDVQPNHVFFVNSNAPQAEEEPEEEDPCCCQDHPSVISDPAYANPLKANPLKANPLKANPLKANPLKANPLKANPLKANIPVQNTAIPASHPGNLLAKVPASPDIHVWVLDTGLAAGQWLPQDLDIATVNQSGDPDVPDEVQNDQPSPNLPPTIAGIVPALGQTPDGWLDPVAGHGTFVAGIVERLTPGCTLEVHGLIGPRGDVHEVDVISALLDLEAKLENIELDPRRTIVNMSFGGGVIDTIHRISLQIIISRLDRAGVTFVASAGNDSSCRPQYPADFDHVTAVGALDKTGPAWFTNFGDWVDACADGVDLVSSFFDGFDGNWDVLSWQDQHGHHIVDPDEFEGWARWSGTSFAAPVVVSAIVARMMANPGEDAQHARDAVLAAGTQVPCLGAAVEFPP